ncbi:MAG: dimethyladenosine transferase [Candidatus Xenolissoclinum pacificiensis L6]|uniref:Ribosomal RNA small subunit methyltransferase A n=1 Tax=Candidatus Xenolissoclinum pacificiensis L6 TaxID=1401685 RepID=W2V1H7_9RICK|nr:MAG: dimethyladenosine transferase [Candidatus Xenolissoclinum pacificiensis L6]
MIEANKRLGQNFIKDDNIIRKIIDVTNNITGHSILEIGPGTGKLTRAILDKSPESLISIEKDKRFNDIHNEIMREFPQYQYLRQDALTTKLSSITDNKLIIISNLPYNIGSRLLINWLSEHNKIDKMVLMFQKEVAKRITAKVNSKNYGFLSIAVQLLCTTEYMFEVSKNCFFPAPKITSAIVKLSPYGKEITYEFYEFFKYIVRTAFQQRRKTIKKSLKPIADHIEQPLISLGIDVNKRSENITVDEFSHITEYLYNN